MAPLVLLVIAATLCFFANPAQATAPVTADEPTYAMLAPFKKQWNITLSRNNPASGDLSVFLPYKCNVSDYTKPNTCLDPPNIYGYGNKVKITYALKNITAGLKVGTPTGNLSTDLMPVSVEVKMCYSAFSYVDRAWRKKNRTYPRLDQNCHWKVANTTWEMIAANDYVNTVVANFDDFDNVPTASMWFMVRAWCNDGRVCQWDSTEGVAASGTNANVVGTEVVMGITPTMVGLAIALSLLGPALLIGYGIADFKHYARTGRPLTYLGSSK